MSLPLDDAISVVLSALKIPPGKGEKFIARQTNSGMPVEIAEQHGRMLTIALACYGNQEMAESIVSRAFDVWAEDANSVTLDSPVESVFPARISSKLALQDISTVQNLVRLSIVQIAMLEGFSFKSALKIENILNRYNISLAVHRPTF